MYSVTHWTNYTPRRSGMFESVKDSVKHERLLGIESFMADPHERNKDGIKGALDDGWFSPIPWEQAKKCDIQVLHSWIPDEVKKDKTKKHVAVLHGPNEHMLWKEFTSNRSDEAFNLHLRILWTYDATIVHYDHEWDILKLYDEHDRLYLVPNSIDLARYQGEGELPWKFWNHPAILSCDTVRLEKLPAQIIWAMPKIVERIPTARLNLFSLPLDGISTWRNMFCKAKGRAIEGLCENIQFEINDLRPFMRGADLMFNNNMNGIYSRAQMEMMAMGKPVIAYNGKYTPYIARIWDLDSIAEQVERCWKDLTADLEGVRGRTRAYAEENFDRAKAAKLDIAVYEKVLGK
jgi:glycosyltransferase involved in cell wall biosynthesis